MKKKLSPLGILSMFALVLMVALAMNPSATYAQAKKDLIDLNKATEKELESLKGVGPATAKKIIENRPYKSVDELSKAGVPAKTIEGIKPLVTVGPAAPPAKPPKPAEKAAMKVDQPKDLIDLNKASEKELESIKGVGPATAKKIIENRPYKSVDELSKAGVPAKTIEGIKPLVTVGPAAPSPKPSAPAEKAAMKVDQPAEKAKPAQEKGKPAAAEKPKPATAEKAQTAEKPKAKLVPGQKVNINTASKAELDALPEIGEVKAQAIIDGRPYQKPEDIMKVKGIKEGTYSKIKDYITVK